MKKTLTIMLAFVLVIAMSVAGTFAYLRSEASVTNTFTVGDVKITLDEAITDEYGNVTQGRTEEGNSYKLIPGHSYTKDPTVTVLAKSEACYVRMKVTINNQAALDTMFAGQTEAGKLEAIFGGSSADWTLAGTTAEGDSKTYEFRYKAAVPYSESNTVLPALFTSLNAPDWLTGEQLATLQFLKITIVAEAIQSDGMSVDEAWAAFKK